MNLLKKQAFYEFITFACIGVVNTLIDFAIYYVLTRHTALFDVKTQMKYAANVISFFCAATFSFVANRSLTFKKRSRIEFSEVTKFYSTTISGFLLNELILFLCVHFLQSNDLVAKAIATVFTILWNFLLQKFWVFAVKAEKSNTI